MKKFPIKRNLTRLSIVVLLISFAIALSYFTPPHNIKQEGFKYPFKKDTDIKNNTIIFDLE